MELLKEHTELIKKLVKANPKFSGNEDLLDDFCSETYQKSYLILQSVHDAESLHAYMKKVVSSAIIDVLKNSGRIVRTTKGYSSVKEIKISNYSSEVKTVALAVKEDTKTAQTKFETPKDTSTEEKDAIESSKSSKQKNTKTKSINLNAYSDYVPMLSQDLLNIKDPRESIEEQIIRKDIIENILRLVKQIDEENSDEMFLKLFYSRYFMQMKQKEIAQELNLSQAEVSKRLLQLSQLIKEKLY